MPQVITQYEELPEAIKIAEKLLVLYPDLFPQIDVAILAAVAITNKERSEHKKQMWELKTVTPPISLFCPKQYVMVIYMKDWDSLAEKHKAALVADILLSISPEGEGKTNTFDLKDHSVILRTLGVDYMESDDTPNLLEGKVKWRN